MSVFLSSTLFLNLYKSIVGGEIWLDPTEEEARLSSGSLVLACMPASGTITSVWQSGRMRGAEVLAVRTSGILVLLCKI